MYKVGNAESDPEYRAMTTAIFSAEGRKAAQAAAAKGEPALSGVDEMLAAIFIRYREGHQYTLANAGHIVVKLMNELGYVKKSNRAKCPDGCTVHHAELWVPSESLD